MVVPTGRNRDVLDLAQAIGDHGRTYVNEQVQPLLGEVKWRMTHNRFGENNWVYRGWVGSGEQTYMRLEQEVQSLPTMLVSQVATAQSVDEADFDVSDLGVHTTINAMQHAMPWLAPQLVRLRHALSQQALENNVAIPAARQTGL